MLFSHGLLTCDLSPCVTLLRVILPGVRLHQGILLVNSPCVGSTHNFKVVAAQSTNSNFPCFTSTFSDKMGGAGALSF